MMTARVFDPRIVEEVRRHGEFLRHGLELLLELGPCPTPPSEIKCIRIKNWPWFAIAELLAVQDVAVVFVQKAAHIRDDAASVGAGQQEHQFGIIHDPTIKSAV